MSADDRDLLYRIARLDVADANRRYRLELPGDATVDVEDEGAALFQLEKHLTTHIQELRSDLLFLHAAAVGWQGKASLLVGDPGAGKSTLTLALLERGVSYLSDELAPVALDGLRVHPYPRALWLKAPPPTPCQLPAAAVASSRGIHVPCTKLGVGPERSALPLGRLFLLEPRDVERRTPSLRRIHAAEATARLFANVLNPGGHPSDGLDAAIAIAEAVACYVVEPGELDATRSLMLDTLA